MTKREQIEQIVDNFVDWAIEQKLPHFDSKSKVDEFRQKYTTDHLAGMAHKYLLPAYDLGLESLRSYMQLELERMCLLTMDKELLEFEFTAEHEERVMQDVIEVLHVLA